MQSEEPRSLAPAMAARSEIDRIYAACPKLKDDAFAAANLARWLA
jgi:hypothetical protein